MPLRLFISLLQLRSPPFRYRGQPPAERCYHAMPLDAASLFRRLSDYAAAYAASLLLLLH